jgi:predicted RNase H-like HicB family nuclease
MTKRFLVVYEAGQENYSGFAPDVPGCASVGVDLEEMRQNMRQALEFHFDGMLLHGEEVPEPVTTQVDFAEETPKQGVSHWVVEWIDVTVPVRKETFSDSGDSRRKIRA